LSAKEIVDAFLAGLDIVIWPVAILIAMLLFRKQIEQLFGILGERVRRISVGGATAEFETAQRRYHLELQEANREFIPQSVRLQGETDLVEDEIDQDFARLDVPDDGAPTSEDTDENDRNISEIEEEIIVLKRRLDEMNKG